MNKALVVIDIQNDITKNYKSVIDNINRAIAWASSNNMHVIYIKHENLSPGSRTFKPNTIGAELAPDLNVISDNIFTKNKSSALTCEDFANFIKDNKVNEFFLVGADATACVKSTCYNLRKANYNVTVLSDCITSWDTKRIPEMIDYYISKGSKVKSLNDLMTSAQ